MKKTPKQKKTWRYAGSECKAHTKSEARAIFKTREGIDRLPAGAKVELVTP